MQETKTMNLWEAIAEAQKGKEIVARCGEIAIWDGGSFVWKHGNRVIAVSHHNLSGWTLAEEKKTLSDKYTCHITVGYKEFDVKEAFNRIKERIENEVLSSEHSIEVINEEIGERLR